MRRKRKHHTDLLTSRILQQLPPGTQRALFLLGYIYQKSASPHHDDSVSSEAQGLKAPICTCDHMHPPIAMAFQLKALRITAF
jgi:hypothetical protein